MSENSFTHVVCRLRSSGASGVSLTSTRKMIWALLGPSVAKTVRLNQLEKSCGIWPEKVMVAGSKLSQLLTSEPTLPPKVNMLSGSSNRPVSGIVTEKKLSSSTTRLGRVPMTKGRSDTVRSKASDALPL